LLKVCLDYVPISCAGEVAACARR